MPLRQIAAAGLVQLSGFNCIHMALFGQSAIRLQPYFGYRNAHRLVISARALRSGKPDFAKKGGRIQAMRTMIAQFASREVAKLKVVLEVQFPGEEDSLKFECVTDKEGFAEFDVELGDARQLPEFTSWEVAALHWHSEGEDHCAEGHVLAPGRNAQLGVISDVDDTIIETGITGGFRQIMRNWQRVVAQLPEERIAVPGTDAFYGALGGGAVLGLGEVKVGEQLAATYRPFFYISSSPWNLFSYLVSFLKLRNLPLGPLLLRDWGLDRATFGNSSHGAHKQGALKALLDTYPDMRFALVGDDTQGDLPAYAKIAADYPSRIAAIFIRAAGEALTPEELAAKAAIEASGVPFWLGETYDVGQDFLRVSGLASDEAASHIVDAVEKAHEKE